MVPRFMWQAIVFEKQVMMTEAKLSMPPLQSSIIKGCVMQKCHDTLWTETENKHKLTNHKQE